MDWLSEPYQFFHPRPELPFELLVARYEVGMARRSILDPPYYVDRPTIRFHLAKPIPSGLFLAIKTGGSAETERISAEELEQRPYLDFTNQPLIQRIIAVYDDLIDRVRRQVPFPNLKQMERLSPKSSEALTLRLTRHGLRIDTRYDVEVVER